MTAASLQCVDFFKPNGSATSGLVPVHGSESEIEIEEQAALVDAASFHRIDYVFFRRFTDGRSSQIAAYVVDNSDEQLTEYDLSKLHHQLWMHGVSPLLYIAWPARIDVLSCARGPDFWDNRNNQTKYNPVQKIHTAASIDSELYRQTQRFSAYRLADGTFWDDPSNSRLARHDKAAHHSLIQAIVETDNALDGHNNPNQRRLLLLTVLIRYLESRGVFPRPSWFGRFQKGARSFFDVLKAGHPNSVQRLLDCLEARFNGDIFRPPNGAVWDLSTSTLQRFAELVEARTLNRQRHLWDLYSFQHLPVEVITEVLQNWNWPCKNREFMA